VTVFKDGHAFVLHEGSVPVTQTGEVVLDSLPTPVVGTFWPYANDKNATLSSVVASRRVISEEREALDLRALLEANLGARVHVRETSGQEYSGTVVGLPERPADNDEIPAETNSSTPVTRKGNVILIRTDKGTRVVNIEKIADVTFEQSPALTLKEKRFRNTLTLNLNWKNGKPTERVNAGMVYLQKGVRWIPSYRLTLDGNGNAAVELEATLVNELTDLENVTIHLVVGVPSFKFRDTLDPISLRRTVAQLSQHFQPDTQTAYAFSKVKPREPKRLYARRGEMLNRLNTAYRAARDFRDERAKASALPGV